MNETQDDRLVPLEYASPPVRRGLKYWIGRFLARLSKPMPLGMYYVIIFVLSALATVLAIAVRFIVKAFE